jgi:hypothetical protein
VQVGEFETVAARGERLARMLDVDDPITRARVAVLIVASCLALAALALLVRLV